MRTSRIWILNEQKQWFLHSSHVSFYFWQICLMSWVKQRRETTKFEVLWRTSVLDAKRLLSSLNLQSLRASFLLRQHYSIFRTPWNNHFILQITMNDYHNISGDIRIFPNIHRRPKRTRIPEEVSNLPSPHLQCFPLSHRRSRPKADRLHFRFILIVSILFWKGFRNHFF